MNLCSTTNSKSSKTMLFPANYLWAAITKSPKPSSWSKRSKSKRLLPQPSAAGKHRKWILFDNDWSGGAESPLKLKSRPLSIRRNAPLPPPSGIPFFSPYPTYASSRLSFLSRVGVYVYSACVAAMETPSFLVHSPGLLLTPCGHV